jgi:hypothetical protein
MTHAAHATGDLKEMGISALKSGPVPVLGSFFEGPGLGPVLEILKTQKTGPGPRGCRNQNARLYPGWLPPETQEKKMEVTFFLPSEARLSTNDNKIQLYTTWDSKVHEKCE